MVSRLTAIAVLCGAFGLAGCGSMGPTIGDALPQWAGGLPKDAPPRPGTPEYEEYQRRITEPKAQEPAQEQAAPEGQSGKQEPRPGTKRASGR